MTDETKLTEWTGKPWDQQPGESSLWYDRFLDWLHVGPKRSLVGLYNAERQARGMEGNAPGIPGGWQQAVNRWRWRERAALWDRQQFALDREYYQEQAEAERAARCEILRLHRERLTEALERFDHEAVRVSLRDISHAVRVLLEESRKEYGPVEDQERDRQAELRIIIEGLPTNLRLAILAKIDAGGE